MSVYSSLLNEVVLIMENYFYFTATAASSFVTFPIGISVSQRFIFVIGEAIFDKFSTAFTNLDKLHF